MIAFSSFCLTMLAALAAGYALGRKRPRLATTLLAALLLLIGAKTLLAGLPHWEWWLLPWPAYAYVQQLALWPVAGAFFGVAATRLPVRWNRAVVVLTGLCVLGYGARENFWLASPPAYGRAVYADAAHHLRQSTHFTCGPAACVAAASHCGVRVSEAEMARLCLTLGQGTRLFNLYRGLALALEDRPFAVAILDLPAAGLLVPGRIAVVANSGGGHALCLVGQGDSVLVHDPMRREPVSWSCDQLGRNYRGPAVLVEAH